MMQWIYYSTGVLDSSNNALDFLTFIDVPVQI